MTCPVVFLDIDGVLTSYKETPGSYLTHSTDEYGISPSCIKALKQVIQKKDAEIVISSSWRKVGYSKFGELNGHKIPNPLLQLKKELGSKIIGLADSACSKVEAVARWLDEHDVDEFVVLDDDINEHFQDELAYGIAYHYFKTEPKTGLTRNDISKVLQKFLGKES